jgi:deoxyribonuclease-1
VLPGLSLADPITFTSNSWGTTKKNARNVIYQDHTITFYCGCDYTPKGSSGGTIDQASCGYDGAAISYSGRASRLEWEHIVPASLMPARQFACWNTGLPECSEAGRSCCERHDPEAKAMIFDLHNLTPSVGQTNALRSNKPYGVIDESVGQLGQCGFEWTGDLVEPPDNVKGDAARVWLYMALQHGLELTDDQITLFIDWAVNDTPDAFEFERNSRIKAKQGNGNPFVELFE